MYHMLDSAYRPLGHPDEPPKPPAYPGRVKSFVYACAFFAEEEFTERASAAAGGAMSRRAMG